MSIRSVSHVIPASSTPCIHAPITLNVSQNTSAIIPTNAGTAVYFPVKNWSILRLASRSLLSLGLITVSSTKLWIKVNRISAIAAARSSPRSSSIWYIIWSSISCSFCDKSNASSIPVSPSTSFVAAKRTGSPARTAWSSIKWIIPCRHLCTAPSWSSWLQKSFLPGFSWYCAICKAWLTNSPIPSFFAAEIGITGMPKISSISLMRIDPPFPRTSSIIFSANTIGTSNSINCMVKYKFRSIFVASTILIIPVGFSSKINLRETISSLLYGERE